MSHFTVLVIGGRVADQLQPFHEFECTGIDDQYVQDVDDTESLRADFNKATMVMLLGPDGRLHDRFDDAGNWKPEFSKPGVLRREPVIPDGFVEIKLLASEAVTFRRWLKSWTSRNEVAHGELPDTAGIHKYGFTVIDPQGDVARTMDRTNPNKKWDWFVVGGRYSGHFRLKPGRVGTLGNQDHADTNDGPVNRADIALKDDIDFAYMRDAKRHEAQALYDKISAIIAGRSWQTWPQLREAHGTDVEAARTAYHAQPVVVDLQAAGRTDDELSWVDLDDFAVDRATYVEQQVNLAGSTFAVLRDGKWYERGKMGWWGIVHDEKDDSAWAREFAKLIDDMPPETFLTVVDCHI